MIILWRIVVSGFTHKKKIPPKVQVYPRLITQPDARMNFPIVYLDKSSNLDDSIIFI